MAKKKTFDELSNTHPGFIIKMELKARGIKQKDFAEKIAIRQSHLSEILRGDRNVSEQLADTIESILGIPSAHLKHLQAEYDFKKKTAQITDIQEHDAEMVLKEYNLIYDMRIILKSVGIFEKSSSEQLQFCKEQLHFLSPQQQTSYAYGRFHKSEKTGLDIRMISTWSVLAQYEANRIPAPTGLYDKKRLDDLSLELSNIFHENKNTENRVARKLGEYGIKFCIVPKVERASVDGYSFIQNGMPTIVITKRYNRIDNMAFAVLHEIGHLKLHLKEDGERISIDDADERRTKEEREANEYAAEVLIPQKLWETSPEAVMIPHVIQARYTAWAKKNHINKWIALGRIAHDTGMYMFKSDPTREIQ